MFHNLQSLANAAVVERATLLANHVLAGEPAATQRLAAHRGRCIHLQFEGWPALLPGLPEAAFRVTPAGLLEACSAAEAEPAALQIRVDLSNPGLVALQALAGERPRIEVAGDAALAGDVNWLMDNLRWDIVDDLETLVGPAAAHQLGELGGAIRGALRELARSLMSIGAGGQRSGQPGP